MPQNARVMLHKILEHLRDVGGDTGETDWLGDLRCERSENVAGLCVVADSVQAVVGEDGTGSALNGGTSNLGRALP